MSRKNEILHLNGKARYQAPRGHRFVQQSGGIHHDKRMDRPGSGGRKRDQIRRWIAE